MKIAVIGKKGQLAKALQYIAKDFKIHIKAFDREELDVRNPAEVEKMIDKHHPDCIINTSAYHLLSLCEQDPSESFRLNTEAVLELAKLSNKHNIYFVSYSSDYVFDGEKRRPYTENDFPNPLQVYGISKLAGEYAALSYNPQTFIIRANSLFGNTYGSTMKKGNFVLTILKQAHEKKILEISSHSIISPTYARDCAKATLQLLKLSAPSGVYHTVNEGSCSIKEFASEILSVGKIKTPVKYVQNQTAPDNIKRPFYSVLSTKKINKLGITLPNWRDGLKAYMRDELGI